MPKPAQKELQSGKQGDAHKIISFVINTHSRRTNCSNGLWHQGCRAADWRGGAPGDVRMHLRDQAPFKASIN
jgi:hypothetical protein